MEPEEHKSSLAFRRLRAVYLMGEKQRRRKKRALILVIVCLPAALAYLRWCEKHPIVYVDPEDE
jgi:hypothetical protein